MIYEMRSYRIVNGRTPEFLDVFGRVALPIMKQHMTLLGFWTPASGELNVVHHLWTFESFEKRTAQYAALVKDPVIASEYLPVARELVVSSSNVFLNPAPFMSDLPLGADIDLLKPLP